MNLRRFNLFVLQNTEPRNPEKSIHTIIESNSHYVVWFSRQPIHGQDLSTSFQTRSFEGAQLQRQHSFSLQKTKSWHASRAGMDTRCPCCSLSFIQQMLSCVGVQNLPRIEILIGTYLVYWQLFAGFSCREKHKSHLVSVYW